ncbi:MAG: hypothetical protein DMF04_05395, partial [Verrucomicrobia bacterium]
MIAVATNAEHRDAAREFFELFKTAWEFYRSGGEYDAVICCGIVPSDIEARVVLIYAPTELPFDRQHQLHVRENSGGAASYRGWYLPVYSGLASIENGQDLIAAKTKTALAREIKIGRQRFIRVGYDLFAEVQHLLSNG